MSNQLLVIVDSKEPKEVIKYLSLLKVSTTVDNLPTDYYIPTTIEGGTSFIVERKTVLDLARSIKDKRIWNQLRTLESISKNYSAIPLLIVEGSLSKLEIFTEWSPVAVTSVLLTAKMKYGVELFFVPSLRWTAITLTSLARMAQVKKEKKPERLVKEKKPEDPVEQVRFVVESLPGVGPTLAARLLMEFGSIYNIVNAHWKDLYKVEGLGAKKAKHLYNLFRYDVRRDIEGLLTDDAD